MYSIIVIIVLLMYMCMGHGISREYYGGINELNVETGQENITSGNTCRDKSYYIIKHIKKK